MIQVGINNQKVKTKKDTNKMEELLKEFIEEYASKHFVAITPKEFIPHLKKWFIEDRFSVEGLIKRGMLDKNGSTEDHEKRICQFFSLDSIFDYELGSIGKYMKASMDARREILEGGEKALEESKEILNCVKECRCVGDCQNLDSAVIKCKKGNKK